MADTFTAKHAATLLDKLASDDKFRASFEKDPDGALKEAGLPTTHGRCCRGKKLASKEQLAAARDEITRTLTSNLALNVHKLVV